MIRGKGAMPHYQWLRMCVFFSKNKKLSRIDLKQNTHSLAYEYSD